MKANEAPEKLYIFNPGKRAVWFSKTSDKQVEYTRTDAFIEKACEWLKGNIYQRVYKDGDSLGFPTAVFLEEFKNAMKL